MTGFLTFVALDKRWSDYVGNAPRCYLIRLQLNSDVRPLHAWPLQPLPKV